MVWVGCSFLWCTVFFVFLLCHPAPWYVDGVDHRDTYVSRRSTLKNPVTSETADVPPFLLVQINSSCAGCLAEGAPPLGRRTPRLIHTAILHRHRLDIIIIIIMTFVCFWLFVYLLVLRFFILSTTSTAI